MDHVGVLIRSDECRARVDSRNRRDAQHRRPGTRKRREAEASQFPSISNVLRENTAVKIERAPNVFVGGGRRPEPLPAGRLQQIRGRSLPFVQPPDHDAGRRRRVAEQRRARGADRSVRHREQRLDRSLSFVFDAREGQGPPRIEMHTRNVAVHSTFELVREQRGRIEAAPLRGASRRVGLPWVLRRPRHSPRLAFPGSA